MKNLEFLLDEVRALRRKLLRDGLQAHGSEVYELIDKLATSSDSTQVPTPPVQTESELMQTQTAQQEPVCEFKKSPTGNYPILVWRRGYVTRIGDKFYSHPAAHPTDLGWTDDKNRMKQALHRIKELEAMLCADANDRATSWRPIETAPMNGEKFWGYGRGRQGVALKVQRDDCEMWEFCGRSADSFAYPEVKPTHWRPLPPAPEAATKLAIASRAATPSPMNDEKD